MAIIPSENLHISNAHTEAQQQKFTSALFILAVLYFMMGFITCLNDTLVPFFKEGFNLSYSQSSLVQFYFFLTYGIMSIPAGKLVEKIGFKNGMVAGFLIAAFGAFLFFPASAFHVYEIFLAALFILATGIVLLQVSANPYITILGPAKTASSRLTLIQGVGSIGTTAAPIFGASFILSSVQKSSSNSAVGIPYLAIGACLLLIALIILKLRLPVIVIGSGKEESKQSQVSSLFAFRNLNFGVVGIFMYVGAEVSLGTFLTNYISDKIFIETNQANKYVAFYWGAMLVGRLIGSVVLRSIRPSVILSFLSMMAIALITLSIFTDGYLAVWTMIAVGLCNSVMFAVIFSLSVSGLSQYTTRASGLLSTAIFGGAIVSFAVGVLKDHFSWQVAFVIPIVCYCYLCFYGMNGYKSRFSLHISEKPLLNQNI